MCVCVCVCVCVWGWGVFRGPSELAWCVATASRGLVGGVAYRTQGKEKKSKQGRKEGHSRNDICTVVQAVKCVCTPGTGTSIHYSLQDKLSLQFYIYTYMHIHNIYTVCEQPYTWNSRVLALVAWSTCLCCLPNDTRPSIQPL